MKIAYIYDVIYPYVKGGAERRFWELAKRLSAKGHEVHLYGMKFWDGEPLLVKDGIYLHGICKARSRYSKCGIRSIKQVVYFTFSVLPSLWKEKFDIIDCNAFPYLPFLPLKFFVSVRKIPLVTTWQEVWDDYWYKYLGGIKGFIARIIEALVIKLSDNIIAHSLAVHQKLIKCGVSEKKLIIIPNGVDLEMIKSIPQGPKGVDLIFAGRLIKDKNVDILIKSIFLIKKEINNIKCLIIGSGPEKQSLIRLAGDWNLKDNIIFKDFMGDEEIIFHMKASKIFVFPSVREGFGIVVLEAMACGLPVITVEHSMNASTELISDGKQGFICSLAPEDFSEKIIYLLKNDTLRSKMSYEAKNSIAKYDWDLITSENEKFYENIISHN